jgi:hypothetical protein
LLPFVTIKKIATISVAIFLNEKILTQLLFLEIKTEKKQGDVAKICCCYAQNFGLGF